MTREEHLQWCKDRAYQYLDRNDPESALGSFLSDMGKHPDTRNHPALPLLAMKISAGRAGTRAEARHFIEGFS